MLAAGCGRSESDGGGTAPAPANHSAPVSTATTLNGDPDLGREFYASVCATCHGTEGQGLPNQGMELRHNAFIAQRNDKELLAFLIQGRTADAPDSVMKLVMPPRGNNPTLNDQRLTDIVAYLRQMQAEAKQDPGAASHQPTGTAAGR
ncbi:MAG TPA: c-type cytochrome [Tepidisphaeraceae bacterium]|nr:c-type cytochrome [Tepidisphaeraceae bacterium]